MKKNIIITVLGIIFVITLQSCSKDSTASTIATVTIGNQVWMQKNLNVDQYRNGDPIPQVTDPSQWANLTTGAWCYYDNDPANGAIYGKLYNWYAVNDPRGLAPEGFHVPTIDEWNILSNYLDPNPNIEAGTNNAGSALKEIGVTHWASPNTGATNNSGFTALPGGFFNEFGSSLLRNYGFWWSATEYSTNESWNVGLYYDYADLGLLLYNNKMTGISVRCIKD